MKKILKWVFPLILGVIPAMGADSSDDASFLNQKGAIYSISEVYEDDERVMALVDVTFEDGKSRQLHVKAAFTPKGWVNNDEGLYAQRIGNVLVFSNGKNEKSYTKEEEHAYTLTKSSTANLLEGNPLSDTDFPLGVVVDICAQAEYLRPNQTPYLTNQLLHQAIAVALINEEIVTQPNDLFQKLVSGASVNVVKAKAEDIEKGAEFLSTCPVIYQLVLRKEAVTDQLTRCYKEGWEVSNRGLKVQKQWRHWWQFDDRTTTTPKIYKILNGQETLYLSGNPEIKITFNHRDEGRTNKPECAPHGKI